MVDEISNYNNWQVSFSTAFNFGGMFKQSKWEKKHTAWEGERNVKCMKIYILKHFALNLTLIQDRLHLPILQVSFIQATH